MRPLPAGPNWRECWRGAHLSFCTPARHVSFPPRVAWVSLPQPSTALRRLKFLKFFETFPPLPPSISYGWPLRAATRLGCGVAPACGLGAEGRAWPCALGAPPGGRRAEKREAGG